jgi:Ca-activated chloride channel family protein
MSSDHAAPQASPQRAPGGDLPASTPETSTAAADGRPPGRHAPSSQRWQRPGTVVALGTLAAALLTLGATTSARTVPTQPESEPPVVLDAALDTPVLDAGAPRRAYLRVALRGAELRGSRTRSGVNLAIVLDRSGSMTGEKLAEARQAAIMAIEQLAPDDIVSVVVYDDTVEVLAPAAPIGDGRDLAARIAGIEPGGYTALFAGVAKGAAEVRKHLASERVSRVILLSDGLANVGPSSPGELAELGASFAREGIAVTTIGLGLDYNEELMTRLAAASDGNHFFAERAEDLAEVYRSELGEILSVLAQEVEVTIRFAPGVRPVRVLGREAEIRGSAVFGRLNQLYARQTKYFLVEVEVPAGGDGSRRDLAAIEVTYRDLASGRPANLVDDLLARYSADPEQVAAARNPRVMAAVARQLGTETNLTAMELRDQGKIDEAKRMLLANAAYLETAAALTKNPSLEQDAAENRLAAENLAPEQWKKQRKVMSQDQIKKLRALGYVEGPK